MREVFLNLVETYARPASGGAGIDQARSEEMPAHDIRGRTRGLSPDLGAYERVESVESIFRDGFE